MRNIWIYIVLAFSILSCTESVPTHDDLKSLNIKGNVVKLEIITQTTIPVSEWFYTGVNFHDYSTHCRNNAIYTFVGNSTITFDENGHITSQNVYDNSGDILFGTLPPRNEELTLYQPINIKINELSDRWNFEYDESNRIVRQTTSHSGKIFLDRKIYYNDKGDIDYVTCNYSSLNQVWWEDPTDTTFFTYKEYDPVGNWIEATIEHKGRLTTDCYKMNVKRAFTYRGEIEQKTLISNLQYWNNELADSTVSRKVNMVSKEMFSGSIALLMPEDIEVRLTHNIPNSLQYYLPDSIGFFNMSVVKEYKLVDIFELEPSKDVYDAFSDMIGRNGTVVLKWYDYSNKKVINNQKCVSMKYAFYATGGYINTGDPVIMDIVEFQPELGTVYTVAIGYDSNHRNLYEPWAEEVKNSIVIK